MTDILAYLDPAPPKYPDDPKICYTSIAGMAKGGVFLKPP